MPKAVGTPTSAASPRSSGSAPARTPAAKGGRSSRVAVSSVGAAHGGAARGTRSTSFPTFDSWPPDLDRLLKEILSTRPNGEREVISAIRDSHPEIAEDLIWSRIVYLGLTDRIRRPYRKHEWTDAEDQILREEYGQSRASTRDAIDKILELHPDWSRDAIVWRARVLGLTRHRAVPPERWSLALDHLLLSLMGCQLDTVARRLDRSKKSVLARLRRLGWGADFFGGFKTKDLVMDLRVSEAEVNAWVHRGWLDRKKGRITEESLRWLCRHHPDKIPFEMLGPETQNWLRLSMDYGRGAVVRHGGRRKTDAPSKIGGTSNPQSEARITS
jgi:hypothetical protein